MSNKITVFKHMHLLHISKKLNISTKNGGVRVVKDLQSLCAQGVTINKTLQMAIRKKTGASA